MPQILVRNNLPNSVLEITKNEVDESSMLLAGASVRTSLSVSNVLESETRVKVSLPSGLHVMMMSHRNVQPHVSIMWQM